MKQVAVDTALKSLGMDPERIHRHQTAIESAYRSSGAPKFAITDTCRLDNGGIQSLKVFADSTHTRGFSREFVAFVPAAGAASRYSTPLFQLISSLESADCSLEEIACHMENLQSEGAASWPLPASIAALLKAKDLRGALQSLDRHSLLEDLQLPKALMPCVAEGMTFLEMKIREHEAIGSLVGQLYVVPPRQSKAFLNAAATVEHQVPIQVLEQGPDLSTIRFLPNGEPFRELDGSLSPVPAGHGALASLFPEVQRIYPTARSIFIRNIDNVMGAKEGALRATRDFLKFHQAILNTVRTIRASLSQGNWLSAGEAARSILIEIPMLARPWGDDLALPACPERRALCELQQRLFHSQPAGTNLDKELRELFDRPVNTLGQVGNTGKDVGGTPCFVRVGDSVEKLCIEVPHASPEDKTKFLMDAAKATHFNPVFVAAEITQSADYYAARNQDFWLLSEKTYRGQKVVYYETVLFELLGNSRLANCAFVDVPRLVFNPHKSLKDAIDVHLERWLP